MEYRVGDIAKIVANVNHHEFVIGARVEIIGESSNEKGYYKASYVNEKNNDPNGFGYWWVIDKELEPLRLLHYDSDLPVAAIDISVCTYDKKAQQLTLSYEDLQNHTVLGNNRLLPFGLIVKNARTGNQREFGMAIVEQDLLPSNEYGLRDMVYIADYSPYLALVIETAPKNQV